MTVIADRVREVSTSSSTGPMTLQGTVVGFRRFRDAIADGATVPYVIESGSEWEVGYGSFTAPATLNRVTVTASSNAGAKVDFAAGQKSIWVDAIADFFQTTTAAVNSVNGQTGTVVLGKSDVGLGNADNTSDANKPVSTATQTALGLKVDLSLLGATSGVATLDSGGKLASSQIPAIAISSYLGSVASQSAMLALTGEEGDWCIRTDLSTTWVITGSNPALIGSWTQLSYPAVPVTSVNGYTGAVSLVKADVGLSNVDNTSDANKPISTATQTALDGKQATVTVNGIVKGNGAGTLAAAVSGTDYAPATSGSAILKGNAAGGFASATAGTDYLAPPSGSAILKANAGGALTNAVAGTDYAPPTSGSSVLKGDGAGGFSSATSGADYAPATSGSSILKGNGAGGFSAATSGTDYAPATSGSSLLKGNGAGGFTNTTATLSVKNRAGTSIGVSLTLS